MQPDASLTDSVLLHKALEHAKQIAEVNIHSENFTDTFNMTFQRDPEFTTRLTINKHFDTKCLIIYRETTTELYTDIYLKKQRGFERALSLNNPMFTYLKDTIYDVNGDDREDYLINWYGASGCCLKNFYDVYLLDGNDSFSEKYQFINPTFSPIEKVIRGVCYGQPGETELYKYRWSGFGVDTVEYVYPKEGNKGKYIRSRYKPWDDRNDETQVIPLNSIPEEYKNIYGYKWFLGQFD